MVTTRSGKSTTPTQFKNIHDAVAHMARGFSSKTRTEFAKFLNSHLFLLSGDICETFSFRSASISAVDSLEIKHYMPIFRSLVCDKSISQARFDEFTTTLMNLCPNITEVVEDFDC